MEKPSIWWIKTGTLLPSEKYNQEIHLIFNKKLPLIDKMRARNSYGFYTEDEINMMYNEIKIMCCPICYIEEYEDINNDTWNKCDYGHRIHKKCIECMTEKKCPICKNKIIY